MNTMSVSRRKFAQLLGAGAAAALVRPPVSFAKPTQPDATSSTTGGSVVRLSANENPYGPSPNALKAMTNSFGLSCRYPDEHNNMLIDKLAKLNGVNHDEILLGDGSGEILKLCAETFTGPQNGKLVAADPTFEAILNNAKANGAEVVKVPLTSSFAHDLQKMPAAAKGGLIYICNPNNPTASITPRKDIEAYIKQLPNDTFVLIDEAYHHFALNSPDYVSFLDQPMNDPRIVVARTFSKVYGLAGMRLGYAVATEDTAKKLRAYANFDNINVASARVGNAALNDDAGLAAAIKRITGDRDAFLVEVKKRNIACIPTQANFAMIETGKPIRQTIDYFKTKNIMIGRPFPPLPTHARITIGKPEEMRAFWSAWDQMKA
jgi:histidinol-phosphate aminotransferase